jgi:hypothetical protein
MFLDFISYYEDGITIALEIVCVDDFVFVETLLSVGSIVIVLHVIRFDFFALVGHNILKKPLSNSGLGYLPTGSHKVEFDRVHNYLSCTIRSIYVCVGRFMCS